MTGVVGIRLSTLEKLMPFGLSPVAILAMVFFEEINDINVVAIDVDYIKISA
jgi:hypothetical protein